MKRYVIVHLYKCLSYSVLTKNENTLKASVFTDNAWNQMDAINETSQEFHRTKTEQNVYIIPPSYTYFYLPVLLWRKKKLKNFSSAWTIADNSIGNCSYVTMEFKQCTALVHINFNFTINTFDWFCRTPQNLALTVERLKSLKKIIFMFLMKENFPFPQKFIFFLVLLIMYYA